MNSCSIEYSVVVPVYNSQNTLRHLVERVARVLRNRGSAFEVILVDDCSTDDSSRVVSAIAHEEEFVCAIRLPTNVGQHQATLEGFARSRGECVITLDDDLQHPPEEMVKLIGAIEQGYLVAIARFPQSRHALHKRLFSKIKRFIEHRVYQTPRHLFISGFKAIKGEVARQLARTACPNPYLPAQIYRQVPFDQIINVDVRHEPTQVGRSRYGMWKSFKFLCRLLRESMKNGKTL